MVPIRVAGTGSYVPEKILSNFDLEKILDTSDEWIVQRTGIRERRIAEPDQATSDLALPACQRALEAAGMEPEEVELLVLATLTPDTCCPAGANWLEGKLGAVNAISFDVTAACSGFVFALDVASQYLRSGRVKNALVVASEVMSRVQDWTDRSNCILWGDGAGAAVLKAEEGLAKLYPIYLGTDGANGQNLLVPGGGSAVTPISHESVDQKKHTLKMIEASASVRVAVRRFVESVHKVLEMNGRQLDEVKHFIPHQANLRMIQQVAKFLKVPLDQFILTIEKYANISSASCAIAFDEAVRNGRIQPGDLCCFTVFGGGLTWGGALVQF